MDPIAEDFPHVTVYNYAENRVPVGIDLWGLQFYDPNTGNSGPLNIDINNNKRTVIDEFDSNQSEMTSVILPTLEIAAEGNVSDETTATSSGGGGRIMQSPSSTPEQSLGLSIFGAGVAGMEKMIDVTADMQSPKGSKHVYGKGGGIAKYMFKGFGVATALPSFHEIYLMNQSGRISDERAVFEAGMTAISMIGLHGAVFGLGAEAARYLNTQDWYLEFRGRK